MASFASSATTVQAYILTIVITEFNSFFLSLSLSSTLIAFDPLQGYSRSWNLVSPHILAQLEERPAFGRESLDQP